MKKFHCNLFALTIFLSISVILTGCKTVKINGQFIDDDTIKSIENKKLSKDEVTNLIGSPTIVPEYSPNNWYYIRRTVVARAWFEPKILEQKITEIIFDKNEQVEQINIYNNLNIEDLNAATEYTKTRGTDENSIQKFIKNIGRFNKQNNDKKPKAK